MKFAIINNEIVQNIIEADDLEIVQLFFKEADLIVEVTSELYPCYIGGKFTNNEFFPPQPWPSWIYDTEEKQWISSIPYPEDGRPYEWDEETVSWKLIENFENNL